MLRLSCGRIDDGFGGRCRREPTSLAEYAVPRLKLWVGQDRQRLPTDRRFLSRIEAVLDDSGVAVGDQLHAATVHLFERALTMIET